MLASLRNNGTPGSMWMGMWRGVGPFGSTTEVRQRPRTCADGRGAACAGRRFPGRRAHLPRRPTAPADRSRRRGRPVRTGQSMHRDFAYSTSSGDSAKKSSGSKDRQGSNAARRDRGAAGFSGKHSRASRFHLQMVLDGFGRVKEKGRGSLVGVPRPGGCRSSVVLNRRTPGAGLASDRCSGARRPRHRGGHDHERLGTGARRATAVLAVMSNWKFGRGLHSAVTSFAGAGCRRLGRRGTSAGPCRLGNTCGSAQTIYRSFLRA